MRILPWAPDARDRVVATVLLWCSYPNRWRACRSPTGNPDCLSEGGDQHTSWRMMDLMGASRHTVMCGNGFQRRVWCHCRGRYPRPSAAMRLSGTSLTPSTSANTPGRPALMLLRSRRLPTAYGPATSGLLIAATAAAHQTSNSWERGGRKRGGKEQKKKIMTWFWGVGWEKTKGNEV